jgi:S-adenosylmethionine-diacylgycerolhomoserine-N-methlytransferase
VPPLCDLGTPLIVTTANSPPPSGGLLNDAKILWHLVVSRARGNTHEERLESFYQGQASGYDAFRKRLLHGREELFQRLEPPPHSVWVDLGAGTGENAEKWGDRLAAFEKAYLVDLSASLLKVAEGRIAARGWTNVVAVHADATQFVPPEQAVDVVTCSYSLTMIPDWFLAIDQALRLLKPGGLLGVVDFFVARKYPADGLAKHGWTTRNLWPLWFGNDNVFPSPDHLPYLQSRLETVHLQQARGKVPYLPFVRAPYYVFVGRKRVE